MHIYLIRHGESTGNKEKAFQGWNDVHLNNRGEIQARQLSEYFKRENIVFNKIYSSPLNRARETANLIKSCSENSKVITVEGFKSINVGDWGGKAIIRMKEKFSEVYDVWMNSPGKFRFPNGENLTELLLRSQTSLIRILNEVHNFDVNIAIISHMMTIKVLALSMLGKDYTAVWNKEFTVPNTGIMILNVELDSANDKLLFNRVKLGNATPHLESPS
ncbi:MAG: histidine phosphatase family protein [Candidatus Hodarchaeales archaeon]|jgi:broad specificity phosphatase PhoE